MGKSGRKKRSNHNQSGSLPKPRKQKQQAPRRTALEERVEQFEDPNNDYLTITKNRIRALRKKLGKIERLQENVPERINEDQKEMLRAKPVVDAVLAELAKLEFQFKKVAYDQAGGVMPARSTPVRQTSNGAASTETGSQPDEIEEKGSPNTEMADVTSGVPTEMDVSPGPDTGLEAPAEPEEDPDDLPDGYQNHAEVAPPQDEPVVVEAVAPAKPPLQQQQPKPAEGQKKRKKRGGRKKRRGGDQSQQGGQQLLGHREAPQARPRRENKTPERSAGDVHEEQLRCLVALLHAAQLYTLDQRTLMAQLGAKVSEQELDGLVALKAKVNGGVQSAESADAQFQESVEQAREYLLGSHNIMLAAGASYSRLRAIADAIQRTRLWRDDWASFIDPQPVVPVQHVALPLNFPQDGMVEMIKPDQGAQEAYDAQMANHAAALQQQPPVAVAQAAGPGPVPQAQPPQAAPQMTATTAPPEPTSEPPMQMEAPQAVMHTHMQHQHQPHHQHHQAVPVAVQQGGAPAGRSRGGRPPMSAAQVAAAQRQAAMSAQVQVQAQAQPPPAQPQQPPAEAQPRMTQPPQQSAWARGGYPTQLARQYQ